MRRGCHGPAFPHFARSLNMGKQTNSKPPKTVAGKGGKKGGY